MLKCFPLPLSKAIPTLTAKYDRNGNSLSLSIHLVFKYYIHEGTRNTASVPPIKHEELSYTSKDVPNLCATVRK